MKKIYHPYFPAKLILITITSLFFSLKFFHSWKISDSLAHLILAILLLLIFIACSKPLIEWKRIEIKNGYIIIFIRFFKPLKIKISESLYQVVKINQTVRSFRFRYGSNYTQVSPIIYKDGDEMTKIITKYMDEHKISVEVIQKKFKSRSSDIGWRRFIMKIGFEPTECKSLLLRNQFSNAFALEQKQAFAHRGSPWQSDLKMQDYSP